VTGVLVNQAPLRVDHVSYAAERDGLRATAARLAARIGVDVVDGGVHPRFGTRNVILPLAGHRYVEVVEVLDHPASDKAPFGQAVRIRSENGGGWLGWVVAVPDIGPVERRLGRQAVVGSRRRPDGSELRWLQLGVNGLISDPQLPFYVRWDDGTPHPSLDARTSVKISGLEIAGERQRVRDWLGLRPEVQPVEVSFSYVAPHGNPGLLSVTFATPDGPVTV